jgi:alpha-beta hydrolase superfamily lysophospholipase
VLCPPLGHEQVHSHRTWRQLADAVAFAGFAALRFDLHGTGDSAGTAEEPDCFSAWLANLHDAIAWMRQHLGCKEISVIGLRLGASLAMQVASTAVLENLLLWAPIVSGRRYVRELRALSLTAAAKNPVLPETSGDLEAAGFALGEQTVNSLSQLDLLQANPRCRRALIVARADLCQDRRLLDHLLRLGIQAEQIPQSDYAEMMAEPHYAKVPRQTIAEATAWLLAGNFSENPRYEKGYGEIGRMPARWIIPWQDVESRRPASEPIEERSVLIRRDPDLFGVLSGPARAPDERLPLILLLNAGAAYHVGPNRLYVLLARHLALQGFRCLRMDLGGLGDSLAPGCEGQNDPYMATAFDDIDSALHHVQAELGAKRVVLMGLCSGAYFAFQSAVQNAAPALVESVLINPLTFFWKDGMSLETSSANEAAKLHYYRTAALNLSNWRKLLCGQTKTSIGGALKILARSWRRAGRPQHTQAAHDRPNFSSPSHPLRDDLPADLEHIAQRGRSLACFFSRSDPGHSILTRHAKRKVRELVRAGKMRMFFCEDADHTFSTFLSRRALMQAVSEHLSQRFPA